MKLNTCHYCDSPLTRAFERDHFPIPERHGGADLVKACIPCHDLKDRLSFDKWPAELIRNLEQEFQAVSEYFFLHLQLIIEFANGETSVILLLQEFGDIYQEFEQLRTTCWPDLGREARILVAKLSFLMQDIEKGIASERI